MKSATVRDVCDVNMQGAGEEQVLLCDRTRPYQRFSIAQSLPGQFESSPMDKNDKCCSGNTQYGLFLISISRLPIAAVLPSRPVIPEISDVLATMMSSSRQNVQKYVTHKSGGTHTMLDLSEYMDETRAA